MCAPLCAGHFVGASGTVIFDNGKYTFNIYLPRVHEEHEEYEGKHGKHDDDKYDDKYKY